MRDVIAHAVRPDGTRVMFVPSPTSLHDETGAIVGPVNIRIEAVEERLAGGLHAQALSCRRGTR